jgi:hypothetical protein
MRTWPSRLPVATRWYERPHDGAHETELTDAGRVPSASGRPDPSVPDAGEGSSMERRIVRREGAI